MCRSLLFLLGLSLEVLFSNRLASADNWPAWRGPLGTGVTRETDLPTTWSKTENVRWKVPLDEPGNSTPILWGNRIFLTQQGTAQNEPPKNRSQKNESGKEIASTSDRPTSKTARKKPGENKTEQIQKPSHPSRRTVICFDRNKGKLLWQKGVTYTKDEASHRTNPYCSSSPVTDGERVIAWFGSAGLICFDLDGNQLWLRDLGPQTHMWGYGASPVIHKDLCFLNFGPGPREFVIAVNKKTGKTVWEANIPQPAEGEKTGLVGPEGATPEQTAGSKNYRGSWSTPLLIEAQGREELIVNMPNRIRAFDPPSGNVLWTCDGLGRLVYTSTMWGEGALVAFGGWHSAAIAVRPGGEGQVDQSHRLWRTPRTKSRLGSGVIYDGHLFISDTNGIVECLEIKTGKPVWKKRLRATGSPSGTMWSSLVLSGEKIYALNQSGDTFIFRAAPKFELLASNPLGESSNSSIAPSEGQIFIRTHEHLWCIEK